MIDNKKKLISRRKLLGGAGKLAYVVPTLTVFSVVANKAEALSSPPCSPNEPGCPGPPPPPPGAESSRTKSRTKPRKT